MKPEIKNNALKYGVIASSLSILYFLIAYLVDEKMFVNFYMGILMLFVNIGLFIVAVLAVKKLGDGFISFKDAFSTFVLGWTVMAVIAAVFSVLLFQVIDPDLPMRVKELQLESIYDTMAQMGADEATIDKALASREEQLENQYTVAGQAMGIAYNIVIGAILGLITAAFMKKNKPVFPDTTDV